MKKKLGLAWKIWDIAYPIGVYYVAISIGIICAQLFFGTDNKYYMICKIIGSLVAIPFVYAEYRRDRIFAGDYKQKPNISPDKVVNLLAVVGITMCLSVALNNVILMSPLAEWSEAFADASDAFYGSNIWLELLGSALITPILEELLHRGVVYKRLRQMMDFVPAILVSSLIFAGLHFNVVQFVYAFCLGLVLAVFVERTGHIYPAIAAHMVANTIAVIRTETGWLGSTVDKTFFAWCVSLCLLMLGIAWTMGYLCWQRRYVN